jgi:hypothetical protein
MHVLYFGLVLFCDCVCNIILYLIWNQRVFVSMYDATYIILFSFYFIFILFIFMLFVSVFCG